MYIIQIEFERVQTFLFAVPRLRDMVGANVLLGEIIRNELKELIKSDLEPNLLDESFPYPPQNDENDPLRVEFQDNPKELYKEGVLVRDGGRFRAILKYSKESEVILIRNKIEAFLVKNLPGIRFCIDHKDLTELNKQVEEDVKEDQELSPPAFKKQNQVDLPPFQICTASGRNSASEKDEDEDEDKWISLSVKERRDRYKFFRKKATSDIIGLLQHQFPFQDWEFPLDFKALSDDGYLAVIHADGNNVSGLSKTLRNRFRDHKELWGDNLYLRREAYGETFFHSMRVAVRRSVVEALKETFPGDIIYDFTYRPYQVLMLGGDDLLLICQAKFALHFIKHYANQLKRCPLPDENNGIPLTIGAGVVIAPYTFPFYRLHELAEELASSAKRKYRGLANGQKCSVVDWHIITTSWSDDIEEIRKQKDVNSYQLNNKKERLILTGRPYRILQEKASDAWNSLEGLLAKVDSLTDNNKTDRDSVSRSKLKHLYYELEKGKRWGELTFRELPTATKNALKKDAALIGSEGESPNHLWQKCNSSGTYLTHIRDLIDLYEISKLGKKKILKENR